MGSTLLVCDDDDGHQLSNPGQRRDAQEILRFYSELAAVFTRLRYWKSVQRAARQVPGHTVPGLARVVLAMDRVHPQQG